MSHDVQDQVRSKPEALLLGFSSDQGMNEQRRIAEIEDSKWVMGWKKVI